MGSVQEPEDGNDIDIIKKCEKLLESNEQTIYAVRKGRAKFIGEYADFELFALDDDFDFELMYYPDDIHFFVKKINEKSENK